MDRTESDMFSGLQASLSKNQAEWADKYPEAELEQNFTRFKEYDLDDTGFITPANLKAILDTMEVPVTMDDVSNMILEIAILSGHDNDGKLSFRDYMKCIDHEKNMRAHNDSIDAMNELALSTPESEQPAATEEPPPPMERMRGSSFAVMDTIAQNRILAFQQAIKEKKAEGEKPAAKILSENKFANKLSKFKRIENGQQPARMNNDDAHKATLKNKLAAFEHAAKKEEPVAMKKTWKTAGHGQWNHKTQIAGGIAPKKTFADLP
jgi:hypothetical protein